MKRTLLLLLLAASPAWGQASPAPVPPTAPAPKAVVSVDHADPVLPGVLVTIDAEGSVGDDVDWDTDSDESTYRVDSGKRKLYFSSPIPGVYRFKLDAYGITDGKIRVSKAKATVTVKGSIPEPDPTPGPTPTPGPPAPAPVDPVSGPLHATLFFDVNDTSVVSFRAAKGLRESLGKLGVSWYTLPTTSPAAQPFNAELARDGSPVVVFQDASGKILPGRAMKAPKSPSELIGVVQAMRSGVK